MPRQPCIICNAEARAALPEGARQITEDLLKDRPANCIPGVNCWNCFDIGYTVDAPIGSPESEEHQAELKRRIGEAFKPRGAATGQQP